jgi:transcriptional regulator with XRE-family HTH domain
VDTNRRPIDWYAQLGIGGRIREFREKRGWSLHELGAQLGVSPATLSNIERDRVALDVERLLDVSSALAIDYRQLLPGVESRHFEIVRRSAMRTPGPLARAVNPSSGAVPYHHLVRPLAASVTAKQIEPFHIRVMPIAESELSFINHGHEEFVFVLKGEVECLLRTPDGIVSHALGEGDCMYFCSSLPHCIRSAGPEPADTIHVLCAGQSERPSEPRGGITTIFSRDWPLTLRERVGGRLKSLRQALRMTVAQFADAAGVGARWLADVEVGHKPIPLDFLLSVSRRFQKPIDYFMAGAIVPSPYCFVQRASDINTVPARKRRAGLAGADNTSDAFRPLARGFPRRSMHPYYVKVARHDRSPAAMHEHYGQEFIYVLNGEVTLLTIVNGEPFTETLIAGDACFIDSTVPHRFLGAHVNPFEPLNAEVIDVFWSPLGENYLFHDE